MQRAVLVALLLTFSVAQADVKLPGTQVSYKLRTDSFSGENASMLFVDALEDPSGKTYVAFVCDLGTPYARFYSQAALGRVGDAPMMTRAPAALSRAASATISRPGKPACWTPPAPPPPC